MTELPPDILALIEAERATPVPDVQQAVRSRIASSVGQRPLGHIGGAAKLVVLALLVVGGGVIGVMASHISPAPVDGAPASIDISLLDEVPSRWAQHEASVVASVEQPVVRSRVRELPPAIADVPVPVEAPTPAPADTVANEAAMLTRAWQALRAGDAQRAFAIVEEVYLINPTSVLEEERRALQIAALAALGRRREARQLAEQFIANYPQSIHIRLVRQVLVTKENP